MSKIILILLSLSVSQISFSQTEKLEVDGAIIISNNADPNQVVAGTIRWTGQDFEGFDGNQWRSLTECDDIVITCPDNRYVAHTIPEITQQSVKFRVELSQNLPLRIRYFPTADPSQMQFGNCEPTTDYGANGNEHGQNLTGLTGSTEYTFIMQSSQDSGGYPDCPNLDWEDISCPIIVTTL